MNVGASKDELELRTDLRRQVVSYRTNEAPGSIIVDTARSRSILDRVPED